MCCDPVANLPPPMTFPGLPFDEAAFCLGSGRHVPNRLHPRLDRQGHPCRFLDLRLLFPPGTRSNVEFRLVA